MRSIYLDHNATAPMLPEVAEAMADCLRAAHANPASQHAAGRGARRVLEAAREGIGCYLGAQLSGQQADQVIFTSGGTEANNLALWGLVGPPPGQIVISAIEHPSVVAAAERLAQSGYDLVRVRPTVDGVVPVDKVAKAIGSHTRLVSVMLANNETGVVQPVAQIAALCRWMQVPMHSDAVQAVGKRQVDFQSLGVTAMTVAAHKFHGPVGIGALVLRHGVALRPLLVGGYQQGGLRPGTELVALAVGMYRALTLWAAEASEREARLGRLRDRLEERLRAGFPPLAIQGAAAERLPHVTNVAFPGLDRQALLMALDQAGVACSTGSACASGSSEPSPVLLAMGCDPAAVQGALRLSLGATTTEAEIDDAAARILDVCRRLLK